MVLSAAAIGGAFLVHAADARASCDNDWSFEDAHIASKRNATPSLGAPDPDVFVHQCLDGEKIDHKSFTDGSIWTSEETAAHYIQGSIESYFTTRHLWNWTTVAGLGFPVSDPLTTADGAGTVSQFALGSIYTDGFHIGSVKGRNELKWNALGGVLGALGYPTTDTSTTSSSGLVVNTFEHGWMNSSTSIGAWQTTSWPVLTGAFSTPTGFDCSTPGMDAWHVDGDALGGWGHVRVQCLQGHAGQRIQFLVKNSVFKTATIPSSGDLEFDTIRFENEFAEYCSDFNCYVTVEARVGNSTPTVFLVAAFGAQH